MDCRSQEERKERRRREEQAVIARNRREIFQEAGGVDPATRMHKMATPSTMDDPYGQDGQSDKHDTNDLGDLHLPPKPQS